MNLTVLIAALAATPAFASKTRPHEVYSATEGGEESLPANEFMSPPTGVNSVPPPVSSSDTGAPAAKVVAPPPPAPAPVPMASAPSKKKRGRKGSGKDTQVVVHVRTEIPSAQFVKGSFDAVPLDQIQPVIQRLELVKELIAKYGRAYDYRTHTVQDLQTILTHLDDAHGPESLPPPASASLSNENNRVYDPNIEIVPASLLGSQ